MSIVNVVGLLAGTLTTSAFLPQVVKTLKTKSTKDISLGMFSITAAGLFLWLLYGIFASAIPVIIANAISFPLACTIIICKLRFK